MNTRNLTNLILLIFIVIGVSIAFLDSDEKESKQAITSLLQSDVTNITIKRPNKKEIYLEKQHGQWRLIRPYKTATNQFRIDTLLRLVETLPQSTYPLKDIEKYGLDAPKLEIQFNRSDDKPTSVKFGDSEPIKMRRYISVGNTLHLTNDTFFYALNSSATDYISHNLLPEDFKIIKLTTPHVALEIKDDIWNVKPTPKDFSVDSINELIAEWNNAKTSDIAPSKVKTKVNLSDKDSIKLYSHDARTLTFYIMNDKDKFILLDKLKGLTYAFPKEKKNALLTLPIPSEKELNEPSK